MVGASKILTVSYGTFSCTLEGFDDPFNTMKAIAEYFRDLAAEDRYFGAEPPTPDAPMLHRIAEREMQRRVEAKIQDNGVILRAQSDAAPAVQRAGVQKAEVQGAEVPVAVAAVVAAGPEGDNPVAPVAVEGEAVEADFADILDDTSQYEAADAPLAQAVSEPFDSELFDAVMPHAAAEEAVFDSPADPYEVELPTVSDMPEGVAARLAKIRAAVSMTEAAQAVSDYAEDQHADEAFAAFETLEDTVVPSLADVSFSADEDAEDLADLAALDGVDLAGMGVDPVAVGREGVTEDAAEAEATVAPAAGQETVAAFDEDEGYGDEPAVIAPEGTDEAGALVAAEALAGPEQLFAPEVLAEADDTVADADADDEVLANLTATFAGEQPKATNDADTIVFNDDDDLVLAALETEEPAAQVVEDAIAETAVEETAVEETAVEETAVEETADDATARAEDDLSPALWDAPAADGPGHVADADVAGEPAAPVPAVEEALVAATNSPAEPAAAEADTGEKLQRARARIIRVRRAPEIAIERPAAPVLSEEAEADLARELAALEDQPEAAAAAAVAADADDDLRRQLSALGAEEPATAQQTALDPAVQDESLRRLMDQTKTEMAEPATRNRLSSIAHLKAAVAATIAERFGSKPKPVEEVEAVRSEPYRNDLARAVRPVRPTGGSPAADRPSPLVLVSEQRIDRPAAPPATGPVTPVRPRRVSAAQAVAVQAVAVQESYDEDFDAGDDDTDNIFGDSKGFAEFADRIGATDLSELLEAAAAYGSAVEGRDHFTRPQLLRQIAAVTGADVSREDELRGFGALLRDGRIVKVKRGQFALTDQSAYLSEARKIGG